MKPGADPIDDSVKALRALTAEATDGRATRARVMVAVSRRTYDRRRLRRAVLLIAVSVIALGSVSAAFTARGRWWRSVATEAAVVARPGVERIAPLAVSSSAQPEQAVESAPVIPGAARDAGGESFLYGQAHALHFEGRSPARALAAWDEYLRRYPRGTLAPEARFNRALCLVVLGKRRQAGVALRPFADGALQGYRRRQACLLLERLELERPAGCSRQGNHE